MFFIPLLIAACSLSGVTSGANAAERSNLPEASQLAFELPFTALQFVSDPERNITYAADVVNSRVVRINLEDGSVETLIPSTPSPSWFCALAKSSDSSFLFASIGDTEQQARVTQIDLRTKAPIKEFTVHPRPREIVALGTNYLLLKAASGRVLPLKLSDGSFLPSAIPPFGRTIAVNPGENVVISQMNGFGFNSVSLYPLNEAGILESAASCEELGQYISPERLFVLRDGHHAISRPARVYEYAFEPQPAIKVLRSLDPVMIDAVAEDPVNPAFFAAALFSFTDLSDWAVLYYNSKTLESPWRIAFTNAVQHVQVSKDRIYAFLGNDRGTAVERFTNPATGSISNESPTASFEWTPRSALPEMRIRFDASSSSDDSLSRGPLLYRWDWNDDGVYDTPFTNTASAETTYSLAGSKTVRLQVMDVFGEIAQATNRIEVAPLGTPEESLQLQFLAYDALFDPSAPLVYLSDPSQRRLICFNYLSGRIEREMTFPSPPGELKLLPGSRRLLAVTHPNIPAYPRLGPATVVEVDLQEWRQTRPIQLPFSPAALEVVSNRFIIATGGQPPYGLYSFGFADGALASSVSDDVPAIARAPIQGDFIYTIDIRGALKKWHVDSQSGQLTEQNSTSGIDTDVFIDPLGSYIFDERGKVLSISPATDGDLQPITTLTNVYGTMAVDFDLPSSSLFVLCSPLTSFAGPTLFNFNANTFELRSAFPSDAALKIAARPPFVFGVYRGLSDTIVWKKIVAPPLIQLQAPIFLSDSEMLIRVEGSTTNATLLLQQSPDLVNWSAISTNLLSPGNTDVRVTRDGRARLFFRARSN